MSQFLNEAIEAKNDAGCAALRARIDLLRKQIKSPRASLAEKIAISSQVNLLSAEYNVLRRSVWDHIPQAGSSTPL